MAENRTGKAKGKGCALAKGGAGPVVRSERETTWPGTCGHLIVFTFREKQGWPNWGKRVSIRNGSSFNPWKNNGAHSEGFAGSGDLFIYRGGKISPPQETKCRINCDIRRFC